MNDEYETIKVKYEEEFYEDGKIKQDDRGRRYVYYDEKKRISKIEYFFENELTASQFFTYLNDDSCKITDIVIHRQKRDVSENVKSDERVDYHKLLHFLNKKDEKNKEIPITSNRVEVDGDRLEILSRSCFYKDAKLINRIVYSNGEIYEFVEDAEGILQEENYFGAYSVEYTYDQDYNQTSKYTFDNTKFLEKKVELEYPFDPKDNIDESNERHDVLRINEMLKNDISRIMEGFKNQPAYLSRMKELEKEAEKIQEKNDICVEYGDCATVYEKLNSKLDCSETVESVIESYEDFELYERFSTKDLTFKFGVKEPYLSFQDECAISNWETPEDIYYIDWSKVNTSKVDRDKLINHIIDVENKLLKCNYDSYEHYKSIINVK